MRETARSILGFILGIAGGALFLAPIYLLPQWTMNRLYYATYPYIDYPPPLLADLLYLVVIVVLLSTIAGFVQAEVARIPWTIKVGNLTVATVSSIVICLVVCSFAIPNNPVVLSFQLPYYAIAIRLLAFILPISLLSFALTSFIRARYGATYAIGLFVVSMIFIVFPRFVTWGKFNENSSILYGYPCPLWEDGFSCTWMRSPFFSEDLIFNLAAAFAVWTASFSIVATVRRHMKSPNIDLLATGNQDDRSYRT